MKNVGLCLYILNQSYFTSTYTRVLNFGLNLRLKMTIRLIRGATYTREYTVHHTAAVQFHLIYNPGLVKMDGTSMAFPHPGLH